MSIQTRLVTTTSISTSTLTTTSVVFWAEPSGTSSTTYTRVETTTSVLPPAEGAFGPRVKDVAIAGTVLAVLFFIAICLGILLCFRELRRTRGDRIEILSPCYWFRRSQRSNRTETSPPRNDQAASNPAPEPNGAIRVGTTSVPTSGQGKAANSTLQSSVDENKSLSSSTNPPKDPKIG